MRLLPKLIEQGYFVYCCVRSKDRFDLKPSFEGKIAFLELDFLADPAGFPPIPVEIDVAYFLIHSMTAGISDFEEKEALAAKQFADWSVQAKPKQLVYLSGISHQEKLSRHLKSRKNVEQILMKSSIPTTVLRAGIIVGSGSASFEIIRDLVEKLPVMIAPRWIDSRCQPIAIRNVLQFLTGLIGREETLNRTYDIGGLEVLSYKKMMLEFGRVRGMKRYILSVPLMTPRLSSYWLYFVTSTNYPLAVNLVKSMHLDVIARPNSLAQDLGIALLSYTEAVQLAFEKIRQNSIVSSWKDALVTSTSLNINEFLEVPSNGVFTDVKKRAIEGDLEEVMENLWSIGGDNGWYYAQWLWGIRGVIDQLAGGVGLRRGRRSPNELIAGDALDFWRVLVADKHEKRLLLHAEMKLPGDAWLEWCIITKGKNSYIKQTATFRPRGVAGRLYWWSVIPAHFFVFNGMIDRIVKLKRTKTMD